jgi:hypothetical protein
MSYFKNKIIDIIEMLEETGMDYEKVATKSGMTVREVVDIARDYGDFETVGVLSYDE